MMRTNPRAGTVPKGVSLRKSKMFIDIDDDDDRLSQFSNHSTLNDSNLEKDEYNVSGFVLAVIIFYNVSGIGIRPLYKSAVDDGGLLMSVLGFTVFPFIVLYPQAVMITHLDSTFSFASGGNFYIKESFGSAIGAVVGYISFVIGSGACAIYPILFFTNLYNYHNLEEPNEITGIVCAIALSCSLTGINWLGLDFVGNLAICVLFLTLSSFLFSFIYGCMDLDSYDLGNIPNILPENPDWKQYLNTVLFLSLNSFDAGSHFFRNLKDSNSFNVMLNSLVLIIIFNIYPLLSAIEILDLSTNTWVDEWVAISVMLSLLVKYQAQLFSKSWQCMGMAQNDKYFLPKILMRRSSFGTPVYALYFSFALVCFATTFLVAFIPDNINLIIEIVNFNASFVLLIEIAAFINLVMSKPDVFQYSLISSISHKTTCLFLFPTVIIMSYVLISSRFIVQLSFFVLYVIVWLLYHLIQCCDYFNADTSTSFAKSGSQTEKFDSIRSKVEESVLRGESISIRNMRESQYLEDDNILLY